MTETNPINIYVELVVAKNSLDGCVSICGHLPQFLKAQSSIDKVVKYLDDKIREGFGI